MIEPLQPFIRESGQDEGFDLTESSLPTSPLPNDRQYSYAAIPQGRILRIQDLPLEEQPRERLLSNGPKVLSNYELLAILVGSGNHAAGQSAMDLAQTIMVEMAASNNHPLKALQTVSSHELQNIYGVGPARATTLIAAIELGKRVFATTPSTGAIVDDPSVAAAYLGQDLMWKLQEHFAVLYLDIKHRILGKKVITVGTAHETIVHPRDVFRDAIKQSHCTRLIIAHNHPSGSLEASPEDLSLTRQLLEGAKLLGIPLLDHLILGNGDFSSIRQTSGLWHDHFEQSTSSSVTS